MASFICTDLQDMDLLL